MTIVSNVYNTDCLSGLPHVVLASIELVPRLLCVGEGKRVWYTLLMLGSSSHILLLYIKITVNQLKCCIAEMVLKSETIALMVTVCIALFEPIGELQRAISCATTFN